MVERCAMTGSDNMDFAAHSTVRKGTRFQNTHWFFNGLIGHEELQIVNGLIRVAYLRHGCLQWLWSSARNTVRLVCSLMIEPQIRFPLVVHRQVLQFKRSNSTPVRRNFGALIRRVVMAVSLPLNHFIRYCRRRVISTIIWNRSGKSSASPRSAERGCLLSWLEWGRAPGLPRLEISATRLPQ